MKGSLFAILMAGLISIPALAQEKIRYVDLQKAIEGTSTGKKAKASLEKEFTAKKKDLEKKEADLKKMGEDFEKKQAVLSDDVKARKHQEFQQEMLKFRQTVNDSEASIRKREQELTQPIVEKLQRAVAEVAKEQGLTTVLHQSERIQTVIWATPEMNITDEVIKKYEKMK